MVDLRRVNLYLRCGLNGKDGGDKMLNKKKLGDFKKMLTDRLTQLVDEANKTVQDISQLEQDTSSDPTDQAVQDLDRNRLLRFKDRERKLIRKIEQALNRIEEGSYGRCELCGNAISEARLSARPMTSLCIDCATEIESEEAKSRLFGEEVAVDTSDATGSSEGVADEEDDAATK